MNTHSSEIQFPAGNALLTRWQAGDEAASEKLKIIFDAAVTGQFDTIFSEAMPADKIGVTTSLHLTTLTILNRFYGLTSADFYKGNPERYVRATLMTQWLLGIRKLTLGWPGYAFSAEAIGQVTMYPDKHAPGSEVDKPLVSQSNWRELDTPDFSRGIPRIIDDYLACFTELTGLDPVMHLSAPYSLAADILGQETLMMALLNAPDFVDEFLDHLTDRILVPWIEHLTRRFPKIWIELSDASGSPLFIGPRATIQVAARPVYRLINSFPWGARVFVANYRGDQPERRSRRQKDKSKTKEATSGPDAFAKMIDFKLSVCPEFVIKLAADKSPILSYVKQAVRRGKPLYLGVGATSIDRNSIVDCEAARQNLENTTLEYVQAIKTVSESLARDGRTRSTFAWPGDIYIEDINTESDFGLVKNIVETVAMQEKISLLSI